MSALAAVVSSPEVLEQALNRLPAEVRAQLAWTPVRLRDALNALIDSPFLSESVIDTALEQYIDALEHIKPAFVSLVLDREAVTILETRLTSEVGLLDSLQPLPRHAAARATATMLLLFRLSRTLAEGIDPAALNRLMASADLASEADARASLRGTLLFAALLACLRDRRGGPGRAATLALKADLEFRKVAADLAARLNLRLPWYYADAVDADTHASYASWRVDVPLTDGPRRSPTDDELEAWKGVERSIDEARPERPLFK